MKLTLRGKVTLLVAVTLLTALAMAWVVVHSSDPCTGKHGSQLQVCRDVNFPR